jgi:hypothetical protein
LNAGEVNVALLPALSVTVIVPVTALPSVVRSSGVAVGLVEATPERPSEVVNGTETSVLFQPAAFAAGVAAPNVSVGAVLSMLMLLAVAVALTFPALSVQVPEADWLAPSLLSVTGFVHEATPEPLSVPVKLTVTSVLFQPWAFGPGEALALAVGGVLSILTAGDWNVLLLPAASVTVTAPVTDAPSDVSISGLLAGFVETTPDRLSVVVKENDTSVLCQPFPFAAGLRSQMSLWVAFCQF